MHLMKHRRNPFGALRAAVLSVSAGLAFCATAAAGTPPSVATIPGMPPVVDPGNLYSEIAPDHFSPQVDGVLSRVYVPNHTSGTVSVIDPARMKVVDTFKVGLNPQHVVPAWD